MIETSNSDINVDELMDRLRERVSQLRDRAGPDVPVNALSLRSGVFLNSLEALVNIADQKSQIRSHWPSHVRGFIFKNAKVRSVSLKALAFLFKDQRHVNQALVAAFRESISLNRHLIEQMDVLREELEGLKRTLRDR